MVATAAEQLAQDLPGAILAAIAASTMEARTPEVHGGVAEITLAAVRAVAGRMVAATAAHSVVVVHPAAVAAAVDHVAVAVVVEAVQVAAVAAPGADTKNISGIT
jgi:hypothetical protein